MPSLLLPSAPVPSQAAQSALWGHGVSLPAWPASCPLAPREASTSSFLSNTNEIFLLLHAPLGSGSVHHPQSSALRCGSVITPHTHHRWAGLSAQGRLLGSIPSWGFRCESFSSRSLLAWRPLTLTPPSHTHREDSLPRAFSCRNPIPYSCPGCIGRFLWGTLIHELYLNFKIFISRGLIR